MLQRHNTRWHTQTEPRSHTPIPLLMDWIDLGADSVKRRRKKVHHVVGFEKSLSRRNTMCLSWMCSYRYVKELDGVALLISDPLPTSFTPLSKKIEKIIKLWHETCDMWHLTCDKWHMTCDMWHLIGGGRWTFYQSFSSLAVLLGSEGVSKIFSQRLPSDSLTDLMTKVFVEQPRLHRVC